MFGNRLPGVPGATDQCGLDLNIKSTNINAGLEPDIDFLPPFSLSPIKNRFSIGTKLRIRKIASYSYRCEGLFEGLEYFSSTEIFIYICVLFVRNPLLLEGR